MCASFLWWNTEILQVARGFYEGFISGHKKSIYERLCQQQQIVAHHFVWTHTLCDMGSGDPRHLHQDIQTKIVLYSEEANTRSVQKCCRVLRAWAHTVSDGLKDRGNMCCGQIWSTMNAEFFLPKTKCPIQNFKLKVQNPTSVMLQGHQCQQQGRLSHVWMPHWCGRAYWEILQVQAFMLGDICCLFSGYPWLFLHTLKQHGFIRHTVHMLHWPVNSPDFYPF